MTQADAESGQAASDPIADMPLSRHTTCMSALLKRAVRLIPLVFALAIAAYFNWPKSAPPDNLTCDLQAKPGQKPRSFGKLNEPISNVRIVGLASKSQVDDLYDFEGRASVSTSTKSVQGSVRGNVFSDLNGNPNGLLLWITSAGIGSDDLGVATLNKEGILDESVSEAFLHLGPSHGVADRLSYPIAMRCRAKLPR
jgi:hypothetical protein